MSLTTRLSIAILIDMLGHSEYVLRLFCAMKFQTTELTFSGLCKMWRKKEYGRMRQGQKKDKLDRRLQMRKKIIEGVTKMEKGRMAGQAYASEIQMAGSEEENDNERPAARKRAKKANNTQENHKCTTGVTCKCGGQDHKRVSSKNAHGWGLAKRRLPKCLRK
jgi:hypothetical protein